MELLSDRPPVQRSRQRKADGLEKRRLPGLVVPHEDIEAVTKLDVAMRE